MLTAQESAGICGLGIEISMGPGEDLPKTVQGRIVVVEL